MAISLFDEREVQIVNEVYRSDNPARYIDYELYIKNEEYSNLVLEISAGRAGDQESGVVLDGKIADVLPSSIKGSRTIMDLLVNGVRIRRFTGKLLKPKAREGETEITAVTGGYWNDKVQLGPASEGSPLAFVKWTPAETVYAAVLRNEAYDHTYTDIEIIETPKITRQGDEEFTRLDKVSDMLASASEEIELFHRDSVYNGHRVTLDRGPARATNVIADFVIGPDIDPRQFEWAPAEEDYSGVMAFKETDDGEIEVWAYAEVFDSVAPAGVNYEIPLSDDATDDEAWQKVWDASELLQGGMHDIKFTLPYIHALIEDGDAIHITQPDVSDDRVVIRTWIAEVRLQTIEFPEASQEYDCKGIILNEEIIPEPDVPQHPPDRMAGAPVGLHIIGAPFLRGDLPWWRLRDDGKVLVDTEAAALDGIIFTAEGNYIRMRY